MSETQDLPAGSPIPGSKYFRAYCPRCGDPMRVAKDKTNSPPLCGYCDPKHVGVGSPGKYLDDNDAYGRADFNH